jgi:glycosyltransferase involved in cell wall biosynthesis
MTRTPFVTVLIPAKDEERWVRECLESILAQDYPHHLIEVIVVVDALSSDRTDAVAKDALDESEFARTEVLRSPRGGTPDNLNAGLAIARGEILCRVDARSLIPASYARRCAELLVSKPEVAVVGGAQVAVPSRGDFVGIGIARALNNRFSMGLSRYRRAGVSGPSDTVYLGAFRTADLRATGGWSTLFPTNQDFELNRRLSARGLVWFDDSLPVRYVPRDSIAKLHQQYVRFGRWKVRYWRTTRDRPRPRQLILLLGVPLFGAAVVAVAARSRHKGVVVGALALGALAVESRGTQGPDGDLSARCAAIAAMSAVATGWLRGTWRELLCPQRDG